MPGPLDLYERPLSQPVGVAEQPKPAPTTLEQYGANWRLAWDDDEAVGFNEELKGWSDVERTLVRQGRDPSRYRNPDWGGVLGTVETSSQRRDQLWADVEDARKRDPKAFADIPKSRDEFTQWARGRKGGRARDMDIAARGDSYSAAIIPGLGFGLNQALQPEMLPALAMGGSGTTLAQIGSRAFLANSIASVPQVVTTARTREALGEEYSANEGIRDVLLGGAFGAGIDVGIPLIGRAVGKAVGAINAPGAKIADAIDLNVATDMDVANRFRKTVPDENRTPDERAALHVIDRQAEVDAVNPFEPTPEGLDGHADKLTEALAKVEAALRGEPEAFRAMDKGTDPAVLSGAPQARPRETATVDLATEAAAFKARVRRAESGGNDAARNPRSSATGRYQFIDSTWLATYRKVYGATGESDAAILGKRADGAVNEALMDRLTADNAAALGRLGAPPTAGNLYLTHFLGEGGVARVLRAADDAPLASVLPEDVLAANPFLRGMRAGELESWAARKMGSRAGATAPIAADAAEGIDAATAAEARLAALDSEEAAFAGAGNAFPDLEPPAPAPLLKRSLFMDGKDGDAAHAIAQAMLDAQWRGDAPTMVEPMAEAAAPARTYATADPGEVRKIVQDYIDDTKRPRIDVAVMAKKLNLDPEQVRLAIDAETGPFAGQSRLVVKSVYKTEIQKLKTDKWRTKSVRTKVGERVQRRWQGPKDDRPMSLRDFVAGIRDDEGADLSHRMQGMTRGGMFIRKNGMSLDAALERAIEGGYLYDPGFNGDGERTLTTSDLIDALERDLDPDPARRVYAEDDINALHDWAAKRQGRNDDGQARDAAESAAADMGLALDPDELDAVIEAAGKLDGDYGLAVVEALNARHATTLEEAFEQSGDVDYHADYDENGNLVRDGELDGESAGADQGGNGPGAVAGDPREGATGAGPDQRDFEGEALLDEAEAAGDHGPLPTEQADIDRAAAQFEDPDSPAAAAQIDSIEHDLAMEVQAQTVRLYRGEAPEGSLMNADMEAAQRGLWFTRDPNIARSFATAQGKVYAVDIPASELDAASTKYRAMSNGEEHMLTPEWAGRRVQIADAINPAVYERQLQEIALRSKSPMRKPVEQDGTMGLGLFDATDQGFRLDLDGPAKSLDDVLREADDSLGLVERARACMVPPKAPGA